MTEHRDPLAGHPYADRHVYSTLREHAPITYGDLHEEAGIPESTFDEALARLRRAGLAEKRQNPRDGRETVYRPIDHPENRGNGTA